MLNSTTVWFILGIILLLSEFLIPGFTIFFFGIGAILTSIIILICPVSLPIWIQITIFIVSSIISLITLRKKFNLTFKGELFQEKDDYTNEICKVVEQVTAEKQGRVLFRGTTWNAYSTEGKLNKNTKAVILGKKPDDPMVFIIKKVKE